MYLSLYRKWRPKAFSDVIAQSHITTTLQNEIDNNKIAHAYLFTGPRGTGKTSCAKIFAKAVNCVSNKGKPCLECSVCKGIESETIMDVIEMDGASNNSVNDIRTLIEEASFNPSSCKYRVYIIDEVHMLSQSAFNALLKIMEEPPSHVIFILATTDVYKVPATIISRCQRFDFHRIKSIDIKERLLFVSKEENIDLKDDAADLIARVSDGAMRDALSLLDQVSALNETIDLKSVMKIIGFMDDDYIFKLHKSIISKNPKDVLIAINELYDSSIEIGTICEQLISFYRNIMIIKTAPNEDELLIGSPPLYNIAKNEANSIQLFDVIKIINALQNTLNNLKLSSNPKLDLEVCLVKLASTNESNQTNNNLSNNTVVEKIETKPKDNIRPLDSNENPENSSSNHNDLDKNLDFNNKNDMNSNSDNDLKNDKKNDIISSDSFVEFDKWNEIINLLKMENETAMLAGFLFGSKAFINSDTIKIISNNPITQNKIIEKKDKILSCLQKVSGKIFKINIASSDEQIDDNYNDNVLLNTLNKAKDIGIDILNN